MTSSLLVYLPSIPTSLADAPSDQVACLCLTGNFSDNFSDDLSPDNFSLEKAPGKPHWLNCTLGDLPSANGEREVYVFVPSLHILSTEVQAPKKQHKHLAQILPFLCEDKLACDLEDVHIAPGEIRGEAVSVRIIQKELLDDLLLKFKVLGITPRGVYSDSEPLMTLSHQASSKHTTPLLWMDKERCLLVHQQQILNLQSSQAVQVLSSLKELTPEEILLYRSPTLDTAEINLLLEELRSQGCTIQETALSQTPSDTEPHKNALVSSYAQYGIGVTPQSYSNLLTGAYAPPRKTTHSIRWQSLALAASLLIGLNLVYLLASGLYFDLRAQKLQAGSEQLYREYFPQDRRIINIRTQTKAHLDKGSQQQGDGFLSLLGQLLPSWEQHKQNLQLKSMRYNSQRKEILIDLESKNISQLDSLQQTLGSRAELLSANEDSSRGVRGRIKFQGGL